MATGVDKAGKRAFTFGTKVRLVNAPLYRDEFYPMSHRTLTGLYYLYDGKCVNGRYKVVAAKQAVRYKPESMVYIGWVEESSLGKM